MEGRQPDPIPPAPGVLTALAAGEVSTSGITAYTPLDGMTLIPGPGDVVASFLTSVESDVAGVAFTFAVFLNGVKVAATETTVIVALANTPEPVVIHEAVTGVLAGDALDIRWKVDNGVANVKSVLSRVFVVVRG